MHVAVARHLRDDRGGGDRGAAGVAVDHGLLGVPDVADAEPVHEAHAAGHGDSRSSVSRRAARFVTCSPRSSMPRTHREVTATLRRRADHERVKRLALLQVVDLGVVEASERPHLAGRQAPVVEQHGRGDQRPGEASAARLVGARHEAAAELAVEAEQAAGGRAGAAARPALGRRGGLVGLRRRRCVWGASRWRRPAR